MTPGTLRRLINFWPPFLGAGIRVRRIAPDWSEAEVELRARFYNRNYVGTHFGGSLYAMADPFFMLMLMHQLGGRYLVWDRAAHIDFVAPGRGTVRARFEMPEARVAEIREQAAAGEKILPEFEVRLIDADGALVATVRKTLYVRLKPRYRPG